jgi:RHS repeat-associated protein
MHADHAWLATHGRKTANGFVVDTHNQLSLIDPQYRYDGPIGPVGSGSIRDVTTSTGSVAAQYSYDPFGVQTRVSGTGPDSDFGFCGYYVHQPSGLLFTQTRAYSPVLGRFLNRDPAGELGSTNLYAYCENDPVNWVDPSGLWPLGLPGQDIAKKKLPPRLKKLFPCLTQNEADQLSNDIIKKLNYGDLGNAKPLINVNSPSDLSPDQSKWLQNFLNSLPTSDQPAIQKILPLLP